MRVHARYVPPEHQADAVLNQAAPNINQWYPVLAATINAKVVGIFVMIQTTGETLEVRITIDGQVLVGAVAAVAGTPYEARHASDPTFVGLDVQAPGNGVSTHWVYEGRSIAVDVRKTTAAGAGNLRAKVVYGLHN